MEQEDGWVDITAHVIAVLNRDWGLGLPQHDGYPRSVLQSDGTIAAIPAPQVDDVEPD